MPYEVEIIDPGEKDRLIDEKYGENVSYGRKASLEGTCIKLLTNVREFKDMWTDNFKAMSDDIRPHGRVFALTTDDRQKQVLYEPISKTCFLLNYDYYGYVKSLALAVAGDFLEEYHSVHSRYSVHGAAIDRKGVGLSIIAPSSVGKTTQAYGLLLADGVRLVADDWFYMTIIGDSVEAKASEKNNYIRVDMASAWDEYKDLLSGMTLDARGRAVVNVRRVLGEAAMKNSTTLRYTVLMKRDPQDEEIFREIDEEEALNFILENDFCNPHLLVKNERKMRLRIKSFKDLFERTDNYLINTVASVEENQNQLRKIIFKEI